MGETTVATQRAVSLVPSDLTATTMRRAIRPGARLMRTLPFTATVTPTNLLERINSGEVTSAPPKTVPPGVPTVNQAGGAAEPSGAPPWILALLKKYPWLPFAVLIVAVVLALLLLLIPVVGIVAAVAVSARDFMCSACSANGPRRIRLRRQSPRQGRLQPASRTCLRVPISYSAIQARHSLHPSAELTAPPPHASSKLSSIHSRLRPLATLQRRLRFRSRSISQPSARSWYLAQSQGHHSAPRIDVDRSAVVDHRPDWRRLQRSNGLSQDRPADVQASHLAER